MSIAMTRLAGAAGRSLPAHPVLAQSHERVPFRRGNGDAAPGAVTDDAQHDSRRARAGQTTSAARPYLKLVPPGGNGEALHIGTVEADDASVALPEEGDDSIRVHLMDDDRDSGRTVPFMLSIAIM